MNRSTRIQRLIADIQETWSREEKAELIDRIHYHGILAAARDVAASQTMDYDEVADELPAMLAKMNQPEGYMTSIGAIDKMTYGIRQSELIVVAGPSSHGKTAIALNMAAGLVEQNEGLGVLFISMEMDAIAIFKRVAKIAHNPDRLRGHFLVQKQLRLTTLNIGNIIASNPQADVIFIDHLHMLTRTKPGLSSYEATTQAVEEVKTLALETNKPIILVSHVRKQRSGDGGTATAADLQGTGAIEQLADFVIMVNAEKDDRRIKRLRLEKSRTKQTVGEGYEEIVYTDGLKINRVQEIKHAVKTFGW